MAKNLGGRPTKYTQELADKICEELSMGNSIRTVCTPTEMPSPKTFYSWLRRYPEFLKQYEVAKQESTDAMAEDLLDIADDGTNDYMERQDKDGVGQGWWVINGEAIQRSRLRVDTRKFLMAKMKPKKYGDKVDLTSGGEKIQPLLVKFVGDDDKPDS